MSRYVPTWVGDLIYGGIEGAKFDRTMGQWMVPCDAEIDMAFQIGCAQHIKAVKQPAKPFLAVVKSFPFILWTLHPTLCITERFVLDLSSLRKSVLVLANCEFVTLTSH